MRVDTGRRIAQGCLITVVAMLGVAAPLGAQVQEQTTTSTQQLEVAEPAPEQTQTAPIPQQPPVGSPHWASVGGFSMDSDDTGYGFFGPQYIRPFRPNVAFIGSVNANYLFYEFDNPTGHTNVRSPGVNVMGGLMFGSRNWFAVQAGPSFRRRWIEAVDGTGNVMQSEKDIHVGFNLGASAWYDPTTHNNVFAMYNYDTVDNYHWGRLAFKEQLANRSWQRSWTPYLGVEYTGQGNENIASHRFGPFVEVAHAASSISVMVGAGWKRSDFDFGPDKGGTYFSIGFYQRLR